MNRLSLLLIVCSVFWIQPGRDALFQTMQDAPIILKPVNEVKYYFDRRITEEDLRSLTLRELSIVRNTIFARAGNVFRTHWLNEYFSGQPWYEPTGIDHTKLSDIDRENAGIVGRQEVSVPGDVLEERKRKLLAELDMESLEEENVNRFIELNLISRYTGEPLPKSIDDFPFGDIIMGSRTPMDDPDLLNQLLSVNQLENMSRRDLRILRNMIFARHGRAFKSESLQTYFDRMRWYIIDTSYTDALLTEVDKKNIKIILSVEQSLGGPMTEEEQQKEDAWMSIA